MNKQMCCNRGITLATLIITVIVITILVTTIGYNVLNRNTMDKLDGLYSDLTLLEEKYKSYYIKNDSIPLENKHEDLSEILGKIADVRNPNDNDEYYYIGNSSIIGEINLKNKGTFIINEKTLTVYYLTGIEVEGKTYYTLPREQSEISTSLSENIMNISDGSWNEAKQVNSPQLLDGMQAVYWDAQGNEHELSSSNQTGWTEWYDYYANKWANAKTKDGSYWVWIPRYEYKIANSGTQDASQIYIKFIKTLQTTPDADYDYIHPAFTDGRKNEFKNGEWDKEIPGFWVAKYVAGFQANSLNTSETIKNGEDTIIYSNNYYTSFNQNYITNALGQNLTQGNYEAQKISYPVFKPLTYVYNVIGVGDCYTISKDISKASDFYGLNNKETNSHLIKNSEYGALIYLTYSVYGRNGTEVTGNSKDINDTTKWIRAVTCYSGTTALGTEASSTNNMSGVFDIKGCSFEFVSGYLNNDNQNSATYGKSLLEYNNQDYVNKSTKYMSIYHVGNTDTATNNYNIHKDIYKSYGEAITETSSTGTNSSSWNSGYSDFPYGTYPFIKRGSSATNNKGMFSFTNETGAGTDFTSFRAVLIGN